MANLWTRSPTGDWAASAVPDDSRYVEVVFPDEGGADRVPRFTPRKRITTAPPGCAGTPDKVLLVRTGNARNERWFALPFPCVRLRINGKDVITGLAALRDKDLISPYSPTCADSHASTATDELVFTTERLPLLTRYAGDASQFCPRCKLPLDLRQFVIACPACGATHHQDVAEELPCWNVGATCSACSHPTGLENPTYAWTPNEL